MSEANGAHYIFTLRIVCELLSTLATDMKLQILIVGSIFNKELGARKYKINWVLDKWTYSEQYYNRWYHDNTVQ